MRRHLLASALALSATACEADDFGPDRLAHGAGDPALSVLEHGREVYARYCVGCHGESGDGEGPAARFLEPRPRDFRRGRLKFAGVEAGETPRDEDYLRILDHGLSGTSMPRFELLSFEEKRAVVGYVRAFYPDAGIEAPGPALAIAADPWDEPEEGRAEGERLYHSTAKCWSCHPAYVSRARIAEHVKASGQPFPGFRAGLYDGLEKESEWGSAIRAPDFLRDRIKTGDRPEDLVRVIGAGVGGTAMPAWAASLKPEELWGLAHYVASLADLRGTAGARGLRASLLSDASNPVPAGVPAEEVSP